MSFGLKGRIVVLYVSIVEVIQQVMVLPGDTDEVN
jgi:hypothetical protein